MFFFWFCQEFSEGKFFLGRISEFELKRINFIIGFMFFLFIFDNRITTNPPDLYLFHLHKTQ